MKRSSFTLIELLVVVAIIAVLVALLLPALGRAREQTKAVVCATQLKQAGIIMRMYLDAYNNRYPSSGYWPTPPQGMNDWEVTWTWQLRGAGLVKSHPLDNRWAEIVAYSVGDYPMGIWRCPNGMPSSYWNYHQTHYGMNGDLFFNQFRAESTITTPDSTVLLTDSAGFEGGFYTCDAVYNPADYYPDSYGLLHTCVSFRHFESATILFCDGHAASKKAGDFKHQDFSGM